MALSSAEDAAPGVDSGMGGGGFMEAVRFQRRCIVLSGLRDRPFERVSSNTVGIRAGLAPKEEQQRARRDAWKAIRI